MNVFETKTLSRDGLELLGKGWEPQGRPSKAVVCLVHGHGEHVNRYNHVAEALTSEGYALFGFDLRGHGRSAGPRGHTPSMEALMQDVDGLLEQARARYSGLPMFLYGHSLGAAITLIYCLYRKPTLKGVVATGPSFHTSVEQQQFKITMAKLLGSLMPSVAIASGLDPNALTHEAEVVRAYINDPLVHDKISLGLGKIMLEENRRALEHASEFPLPLLLMHGKEDTIAFPSSSVEFAAPLKEKCTLMLWNDMMHEIHNETEQREVFKTMTIWMDARLNLP